MGSISALLAIGLFFLEPQTSNAASGGRIGGGSFRSTPSVPSSRGYGGGYRGGYGGGGYRGGNGIYRGSGIGFPFLLPIFGFGGGGLFGFLILMSIVGVIVNSIRGNISSSGVGSGDSAKRPPSSVTMIQLQLGLLASAKDLQKGLRELASSSETSTPIGLQRVLQDTSLALLRQTDLWVYGNIETGLVPFNSAESTFNRLSMIERSKLKAEITSNYSGRLTSDKDSLLQPGDASSINEYIAVSVIVASSGSLEINESNNFQQLCDNVRILGSIPSSELIALEVIWQPEGSGEVLSSEELITAYPNLKHF